MAAQPVGAHQGTQSYAIVSSYGIYERDVRRKLDMKFPRAGALSWMRAVNGRMGKRKAIRHEYSYWEEGQWMNATATVAVIDVIGAPTVIITLSAGDHYDSGTKSFPVVGQTVLFEDERTGYIQSIDRTVADAHTITVVPTNSTIDLSTVIATETIVFFSNAQTEKSFQTESRIPRQVKISNKLQTFRERYGVTDHEMQNQTEWDYKGQKYLYVKGTDETADRFEFQEELGLLVGHESDGLVDANGDPVQTAYSLIQQTYDHGITHTYTTAPDMANFDSLILKLQKNYADREYICGRGIEMTLAMKNFLIDFEQASPEVFFNEMKNKDQALYFRFRTVDIENYKFHMQDWEALSHPDTLGNDTMPYKGMAIMIPAGSTRDPNTNSTEPYMKLVYADPGGSALENRGDHKIWQTGALAKPNATDDEMIMNIHWYSVKGFELRARHKFAIWKEA